MTDPIIQMILDVWEVYENEFHPPKELKDLIQETYESVKDSQEGLTAWESFIYLLERQIEVRLHPG